jgi:hypothetical protein
MTRTTILTAAALALFAALAVRIATLPAMWWLSDAQFAQVVAQAEAQHGHAAAQYLKALRR